MDPSMGVIKDQVCILQGNRFFYTGTNDKPLHFEDCFHFGVEDWDPGTDHIDANEHFSRGQLCFKHFVSLLQNLFKVWLEC